MQQSGTTDNFAKNERISLRIDSFTKELIEQAANLDHRSITGFIVDCAKHQAEQILEREKTIRLNKREWNVFMDALANPPKPNAALKRSAKRYRELDIKSNA